MSVAFIHLSALRAFDIVSEVGIYVRMTTTGTVDIHTDICTLPLNPAEWILARIEANLSSRFTGNAH
jgi:hypothetical protein